MLFSPSYSQIAPRDLADWIVADRLPVRFQMQLHKSCGTTSRAAECDDAAIARMPAQIR